MDAAKTKKKKIAVGKDVCVCQDKQETFVLKNNEAMLNLNTLFKEQNVRFSLKRNKNENFG